MSADHPNMPRVSAKRPCPVCKKPDWCLAEADGSKALCQRVESNKPKTEAGWLHILVDQPSLVKANSTKGKKPVDWPARAAEYHAAMTPAARSNYSTNILALPATALDALPLVGYVNLLNVGECATFPEADGDGKIIGIGWRCQDGTKKTFPGSTRGLILPPDWETHPGTLLIFEGPSDVAAARAAGLNAIGRFSNSGGSKYLFQLLKKKPANFPVIVVGENDKKEDGLWPGKLGAEKIASTLAALLGRPIKMAMPPGGFKDVRVFLTSNCKPTDPPAVWASSGRVFLKHVTENAKEVAAGPIVLGADEHRVVDECLARLAVNDRDIFQRGRQLVRLHDDPDTETLSVAGVELADLRTRVTATAKLVRWTGEEMVPANPPPTLAAQVAAHATKGDVRRLLGISTVPIVRADGSVHNEPGYDPETMVVFVPGKATFPRLPETLTHADVKRACSDLLELLGDFPFEGQSGRGVWLSLILSVMARHLFAGPAPHHHFDANTAGTGKSLLLQAAGAIFLGVDVPTTPYATDPIEMAKKITTACMAAKAVVLFDNIASGGSIGNSALECALTSTVWSDRILGGNKDSTLPLRIIWALSGNNIQYAGDMPRRAIRARLVTGLANPEDRDGFRLPKLLDHIKASRPLYVVAALTIVAGFIRAGRPALNLSPTGSFEGWSDVVRSAIVWAGGPDPWDSNLEARKEVGGEANELALAIAAWNELAPNGECLTVAEAKRKYDERTRPWKKVGPATIDGLGDFPLPATAELIATTGLKEFEARGVGNILKKYRNRVDADGRTLVAKPAGGGAKKWWVKKPIKGEGCLAGGSSESGESVSCRESHNRTEPNGQEGESGSQSESVLALTRGGGVFAIHPPIGGRAGNDSPSLTDSPCSEFDRAAVVEEVF